MVFDVSNLVNANTTSEDLQGDCVEKAYNYGTIHGGGDSELEYALTDAYCAGCIG